MKTYPNHPGGQQRVLDLFLPCNAQIFQEKRRLGPEEGLFLLNSTMALH